MAEKKREFKLTKRPKQLTVNCINCYRFYFIPEARRFEENHDDVFLDQRVLSLLLVSRRFRTLLFGSQIIFSTDEYFYANGPRPGCVKYRSHDLNLLILLGAIVSSDFVIYVNGHTGRCFDVEMVKLIYLAKRLKLALDLDPWLRTRLVDQLLADVQLLKHSNPCHLLLPIHYGLEPVVTSSLGEFSGSKMLLCNDICRYDRLPVPYGLNHSRMDNLKTIEIRNPYYATIFDYNCKELFLTNMNFITIVQYLPLPPMPNLEALHADVKYEDLNDDGAYELFSDLMSDLQRKAPKCIVMLSGNLRVFSKTYKQQRNILRSAVVGIERFALWLLSCENIFLDGVVNVNLPLSEEDKDDLFFEDITTDTPYRSIRIHVGQWNFTPIFNELVDVNGRSRVGFDVICRFDDNVLDKLGDKDLHIIQ
ncbi:unnamed protein product [Bursaphelenchus xylophilus]|uniref:(pine wood nematode) hypothetical protein n=1 Tax=Bursaphelenchus xylophilus TaxID=6326 RepID=A0A1I7S4C6_BURXY|nr:unnamed protein product [Bursaphelenchus xylophilus]CAG9116953.1 unnamed protein product [Bursaphelenchus xylophilus]